MTESHQTHQTNTLLCCLTAEIMMTAGPRKAQDEELGEDVAGVLLNADFASFWIADGTSETPNLQNADYKVRFSSRLLAVELAQGFRTQIEKSSRKKLSNGEIRIENLLKKLLDGIVATWNQSLAKIPEEGRSFLDRIFSAAPGMCLDFSSTFTCGILAQNGDFQGACYGDAPLLIKRYGESIKKVARNNYRFFMRLNKQGDKYKFTTSNEHRIDFLCFNDVEIIVAGSDGIGRIPDLIEAQCRHFSFEEIRSRIYRFFPGTKDDKTLCILARIQE